MEKGRAFFFFFLSCSSLHDRPCIVIMYTFSESFLSFYPNPFCSVTAQGPRTVEIGPAGVLFLTSSHIMAEDLAPTQLHPPTVSSSLRMQTENQCLCLEWRGHGRQEAQLFSLNLLVHPALLTAACSVVIQQFIKCDIHVCGTLL